MDLSSLFRIKVLVLRNDIKMISEEKLSQAGQKDYKVLM